MPPSVLLVRLEVDVDERKRHLLSTNLSVMPPQGTSIGNFKYPTTDMYAIFSRDGSKEDWPINCGEAHAIIAQKLWAM